ncbi:elongation factor-1 alpha [Sulfurivirga sp.]|uniref:elongation factor-1 alpha n=1 Tax=Sulfurivirga sp. TaxID=2614236 RepID=UPI0025CD4CE4|nr:elongation factor-1 alpha [Sulfurivirga sp.]
MSQQSDNLKWLNLTRLALPVKVLFTGYLMAIGVGLMMAGLQIMLTHGMADGKFGLSVDDIVYSYYGNRTGSKLESKLNGSMKDKAPPAERLEIIKWARNGADKREWEQKIRPIVMKRCAMCHANIPSLPNVTKYDVIAKLAEVDHGASISQLTRVSHIHLFGISFIFMFVGFIFSFAVGFSRLWKMILIFTPFAFLIIDVASWWLTKWNPHFAWFTIIGGFAYTAASTVMILSSLWQMWIMPWKGQCRDCNAWKGDCDR